MEREPLETKQASSSFSVLALRIRNQSPFLRYLYIKPHHHLSPEDGGDESSGQPTENGLKDRALFVSGLPIGIGEEELNGLLGQFGAVEQVVVHEQKASAIAVFTSRDGSKSALQAARGGAVLSIALPPPVPSAPRGLKWWVGDHKAKRGRQPEEMAAELDSWLQNHEAEQQQRKEEQQAALEADGWTVVVRHKGRKKNVGAGGMRVAGVAHAAAQAAAQNKQPQRLDNFYRFQKKDRVRNELFELRERFEEDRKRLQQLKAARRFKPY